MDSFSNVYLAKLGIGLLTWLAEKSELKLQTVFCG